MSEESGEPKPRKLKLSSSRNPPDTQESATTPKATTHTPSTPEVDPRPKVTLKTTTPEATPTPIPTPLTTTAAINPPPPLKGQAAPATPPPLKKSPSPRSGNTPLPSAGKIASPIPSPPPKDDPLGSILILAGLLFILAAAAGGIWYLFQSDQSEPTEDIVTDLTTEIAPPTNPIERAKATIESVPARNLDTVIDSQEAPNSAVVTAEAPAPTTTKAAVDAAASQALKQAVSIYLQSVHIGGVRTGPRARIMLNGENYDINDIVETTIGLKFIGTRNQKLLFQDPNGVTYAKSF